jgi:hypothetical protein
MRAIIITVLFIITMSVAISMADIPVEGIKQYSYQYVINNTDDYPEYVFLTSSEIWNFEHPSLIINGTFGGGYKLDGFVLHAMKEVDLDKTVKEKMSAGNQGENIFSKYFASAPLATSDLLLPVSTGMNDTIPLSNITVLLEVEGIIGTELNVSKTATILGFENGTVQAEENDQEEDILLADENEFDLLHSF